LYRYSSVYNSHLTEKIKKTISIRQNEVKGAITTVDKQLIVLENKIKIINLSDNNKEVAIVAERKTKILRQLKEELKGVKAL
jgi:tRNA(Ile2) C34 agmatinyltransferase TiaS